MARPRKYAPLDVFLNSRQIGKLTKEGSGAFYFTYNADWLRWEHALPVSLSLPLREDAYSGASVLAVFENLLPDNEQMRSRVASKFHAEGTDPFSLLSAVGKDCVGALQFLQEGSKPDPTNAIQGVELTEQQIAGKLKSLSSNPLGLDNDNDFRISIAGAQEKTALHKKGDKWIQPSGTTPTTHIFKTQSGQLSNGLNLTHSVENEYLCLNIARQYGFEVANATIENFDDVTALVVERFDRKIIEEGQLLRLPQEDCCQVLSYASTQKYQRDGGPGIEEIMKVLIGSDEPVKDRQTFFKAQVLFWLLGATDGHAKNFSLALFPKGRFRLTPLYDILSLQHSVDNVEVLNREYKMAMRVGGSNKYRVNDIHGRHFVHTGKACGLSAKDIERIFSELNDTTTKALTTVQDTLPDDFPQALVESIVNGIRSRLPRLNSLK